MERFFTGEDQAGDRKIHLPDDRVLLLELHRVGFDQRVPVFGDVLVLDAFSVERIEPDPRADLGIVVAEHCADVALAAGELLNEFACRSVACARRRHILIVLFPGFRDVSDVIVRVEERFEIRDEIVDRIPRLV